MVKADETLDRPAGLGGVGSYVYAGGLWRPVAGVSQGDGSAAMLVSGAGITPTATSLFLANGNGTTQAAVTGGAVSVTEPHLANLDIALSVLQGAPAGTLNAIRALLAGTLAVQPAVGSHTQVATDNGYPQGSTATVTGYGKLRTSPEAQSEFYDPFDPSASFDAVQWTYANNASSATITSTTGSAVLTSGTTADAWATLTSIPKFVGRVPGYAEVGYALSFAASPPTGIHRFWGVGTGPATPTTGAPLTDAVGWEVATDGKLYAVVYASGVRTQIADLSAIMPTDGLRHRYSLVMRTDRVFWYLDSQDAWVARSNFQTPDTQRLPLRLSVVNQHAPAPTAGATITCTGIGVGDSSRSGGGPIADGDYPWRKAQVDAQKRLVVTQSDSRGLTERMLAKAPQSGYKLWLDPVDATYAYIAEAVAGSNPASDLVWSGVRIGKAAAGAVATSSAFAWNARAAATWAS